MDNEYSEVEIIKVDQPGKLFQQERASIDVQVATAKMYPRNIRRCVDNAVAIATISKEVAESCTYAVPRGGKTITGPSVHLAKIIAQNWGNIRIQNKVVDIDLKHITSQAICWDLESNVAIQTEVKRLIIGREGRYSEDMITVTGNAANSISLRNAIFAVIPKQVIDKVYDAAKRKIVGKLDSEDLLIAKRKEMLDGFKDLYGVSEQEVLSAIGKPAIQNITKDDILVLAGIFTSIKDGDTSVDEAFRNKKKQERSPESSKMDRLIQLIADAKTIEELQKHKQHIKWPQVMAIYDEKYAELIKIKI